MEYKIDIVTKKEFPEIVDVWEVSVRATHHFLKEEDIQYFKPLILNEYLNAVNLRCIKDSNKKIIGFLGVSEEAIEMLFILPQKRGKGVGKALLNYAIKELASRKVDVNEQNKQALGFYQYFGFRVIERSELDATGKPYPVLHMEYTKPRIEKLATKKLVGNKITMSVITNKTGELWKDFMQRRTEVHNRLTDDMISMQVYDKLYFDKFDPAKEFVKWATVEVADFENVPDEMEIFTLEGGLYAVFDYKGSSTDTSIFQYIFTTWLPNSKYTLDDRPHFEVLGSKYKNNDPNSEEEIWIPIKPKFVTT
jgi:AraC family transcriptional regulator